MCLITYLLSQIRRIRDDVLALVLSHLLSNQAHQSMMFSLRHIRVRCAHLLARVSDRSEYDAHLSLSDQILCSLTLSREGPQFFSMLSRYADRRVILSMSQSKCHLLALACSIRRPDIGDVLSCGSPFSLDLNSLSNELILDGNDLNMTEADRRVLSLRRQPFFVGERSSVLLV